MTPANNTPVQADALVIHDDRIAFADYSGMTGAVRNLVLSGFYDHDHGVQSFARHRHAHQPTTDAEAEPVAWESTTICYTKYITDSRYRKLRPGYQKWYKPYRCSSCAHPPADKARIAKLEAALAPFALHIRDDVPDEQMIEGVGWTAADYRAARAALENRDD